MLTWKTTRKSMISATFAVLALLLSGSPAAADPDHRGGERREHHQHREGHRHHEQQWRRRHPRPYPVPLAVAPPAYYVAPAPVMMAPPPSVNIVIPLR